MNLSIYNFKGLLKLKRNEKLQPNKIFLIGSEAVTNSLYFRRPEDIQNAHKLINQKLSGILVVIDYLFTSKGWLLLIKLKSESEINNFYRRSKGYSQDKVLTHDVGRIISEVIRLTISAMVGFINKGSNRKGTLVYRAFIRFSISSLESVKRLIGKMKKREIILSNQGKSFRPSLKIWNNKVLPIVGMSFLCSTQQKEIMDCDNSLKFLMKIIDVSLKTMQ